MAPRLDTQLLNLWDFLSDGDKGLFVLQGDSWGALVGFRAGLALDEMHPEAQEARHVAGICSAGVLWGRAQALGSALTGCWRAEVKCVVGGDSRYGPKGSDHAYDPPFGGHRRAHAHLPLSRDGAGWTHPSGGGGSGRPCPPST